MPDGDSSKKHVPTYQILVDGQQVDQDIANAVREINVQDSLGLPDACILKTGFKSPPKEGDPMPIDKHPFAIGAKLEIKLGAAETDTPKTLFEGDILTLEPLFGEGGIEMEVRAYDKTHLLHRGRRTRSWANQTASDIVQKVLQDHSGISAQVDSSGSPFVHMQQSNETDWDFIWRLADRIGFELAVTGATVKFRKPGQGDKKTLTWKKGLFSFSPRVTAVGQVAKVTLKAWDPETKAVFESEASEPNQLSRAHGISRDDVRAKLNGAHDDLHVATASVGDKSEGDGIALALLDRIANSYAEAEGVAEGDPDIRAGTIVTIDGVGDKFGGDYRLHSTRHVLKGGGAYVTQFSTYQANTITEILGAGGSNGTQFSRQLVVAQVTDNEDPDSMGRVKVKFPALGEQHEGAWARIATPSAGKARGLLMLPVKDEEVLIGFENGDTTRPYVLGSLFNGKDTPGDELADSKGPGSFTLLSDHKITARAKEEIEVTTDKTYTIKVKGDVTESFDAKWTMTAKGDTTMTIQSSKLTIKADQDITIQSNMGNVTIQGMQVKVTASAGLTLDGGAQTKVSGGMIQIG